MARACTVCTHPAADDIDSALVAGTPYRQIVKRYVPVVSISTLTRHRQDHLSAQIVALSGETATGTQPVRGSLVEQLQAMQDRVLKAVDTAEKEGKLAGFLAAMRETRALLELQARITGELDERPTVQVLNLQASPEWTQLRLTILQALAPYPEARQAVADALSGPRELTS